MTNVEQPRARTEDLPGPLRDQLSTFDPGSSAQILSDFGALYHEIEAVPHLPRAPHEYFDVQHLSIIDLFIKNESKRRMREKGGSASCRKTEKEGADSDGLGGEDNALANQGDPKRWRHTKALGDSAWKLRPYQLLVDFGPGVFHSSGYLGGLRRLAEHGVGYDMAKESLRAVRERRKAGSHPGVDQKRDCVPWDTETVFKEFHTRGLIRDKRRSRQFKRKITLDTPALSPLTEQDDEGEESARDIEHGRGFKCPRLFEDEVSSLMGNEQQEWGYDDSEDEISISGGLTPLLNLPVLPSCNDGLGDNDVDGHSNPSGDPPPPISSIRNHEADQYQDDTWFAAVSPKHSDPSGLKTKKIESHFTPMSDSRSTQDQAPAVRVASVAGAEASVRQAQAPQEYIERISPTTEPWRTNEQSQPASSLSKAINVIDAEAVSALSDNFLDGFDADTLATLQGCQWLNDTAVYYSIMAFNPDPAQIFVVDSIPVTNPNTKIRFKRSEKYVVPLHHSQEHWTVAIATWKTRDVEIFDPWPRKKYVERSKALMSTVVARLDDFYRNQCSEIEEGPWTFSNRLIDLQQTDNYNCGIYAAVYAICRMHDLAIPSEIRPRVWRWAFAQYATKCAPPQPAVSSLGNGRYDWELSDDASCELTLCELARIKQLCTQTSRGLSDWRSKAERLRCEAEDSLRVYSSHLNSAQFVRFRLPELSEPVNPSPSETRLTALSWSIDEALEIVKEKGLQMITEQEEVAQKEYAERVAHFALAKRNLRERVLI